MYDEVHDYRVRMAAFDWLDQVLSSEEVVRHDTLLAGFTHNGHRVPLIGPQGIFKPRVLDLPLSITTAPRGPYNDAFGEDGLLDYKYRGTDPQHRDNVGLRTVMYTRKPLVYLHGLVPGRYLAAWPVFVVADDPKELSFRVAVDDRATIAAPAAMVSEAGNEARRAYITATVRRRLHQGAFRERVLAAYRDHCALCRLKRPELLDAAHILPDSTPHGEPVVRNGLALCKLHHAAFDRQILGIRPDYVAEIRLDILEEVDGPMLRHGLQEMHGTRILLPKKPENRPDPAFLATRYDAFRHTA